MGIQLYKIALRQKARWVLYRVRLVHTSPAQHCGSTVSVSAYLLNVRLYIAVLLVIDLKAVAELTKVNGDAGRVAGLPQWWLPEKETSS